MSLAGGVNVTRSARMGASGIEGSEGGFTWPDDLPAPPASPARDNTDELAAALADLPSVGPWVELAACGPLADAPVWTADDEPDVDELALAERVCRRCPVRPACADYAATAPVYGVWGGVWHGQVRKRAEAA